jgi:hypothetical protein
MARLLVSTFGAKLWKSASCVSPSYQPHAFSLQCLSLDEISHLVGLINIHQKAARPSRGYGSDTPNRLQRQEIEGRFFAVNP